MKHAVRCLALSLLSFAPLGAVPTALAAEQGYSLTWFDAIRMDGPFRVIVTTGGGISARAQGERAALDRIDLSVSGRLLTIKTKAPRLGDDPVNAGAVTVRLSTQQISRIIMSGSGSLELDKMKGLRASINVGGSGDVKVGTVMLDTLNLGMAGSGRVGLAGTAGALEGRLVGSGALDAAGLKVQRLKLTSEGPGTAEITITGTAQVVAVGSGNITILGKPACQVTHAGSGTVICGGEAR